MTFHQLVCSNDDNFNDDSEEIPGVVNMDFEASDEYWIIFDFDLISNPMFQFWRAVSVAIYEDRDRWSPGLSLMFA
jgi:hypothetical protein